MSQIKLYLVTEAADPHANHEKSSLELCGLQNGLALSLLRKIMKWSYFVSPLGFRVALFEVDGL